MRSERGTKTEFKRDALFPDEIAAETKHGHEENHEIKYTVRPQVGYDAVVLGRETNQWCDGSIDGKENHGESE